MNPKPNPQFRLLAISLSSRGFGYAVMEENDLIVDYGKKIFQKEKNSSSIKHINGLITRYEPDVLVLNDVHATGTHRAPRIKELHQVVIAMAKQQNVKVAKYSNAEVRTFLLNDPKGTKQAMAETLAEQYPDELASRLPPKRRDWESEDARIDIFDAFALGLLFAHKRK